LLFRKRFDS